MLIGHSWKIIESSNFSNDVNKKVWVAIEVCERCGKLRIAEEIYLYEKLGLRSIVLVVSKDLYKKRRDLLPKYIVG
jgi:hypothetical protein